MKLNSVKNHTSFGASIKFDGFPVSKKVQKKWQDIATHIGSDQDVITIKASVYGNDNFIDTGVVFRRDYDVFVSTKAKINGQTQYENYELGEYNRSYDECKETIDNIVRNELDKLKKLFPKMK